MKEFISKRTREVFREHMVSWHVVRTIRSAFENEDIYEDDSCQPGVSGERRWLVERFYHALDLTNPSDVARLFRVYETLLLQIPEDRPEVVESLVKWLRRDGFDFINGRVVSGPNTTHVIQAKVIAERFDAAYMRMQIDRMEKAIEGDPDLAVDSAKALVETTCKTILKERGIEPDSKLDIPQLVKATQKILQLVPEDVDSAAKAADSIKKILGSLSAITGELAFLRNLYGSSHGKHAKARGLSPRHARLAVGAASTLAVFLFETHTARTEQMQKTAGQS